MVLQVSNATVMVGGQEYEMVWEDARLVGLRRFNNEYRMWMVVKFSDDAAAEAELLQQLKTEYIRQQLSDVSAL